MREPPLKSETVAPAERRRSQGQFVVARALWYVKPGVAELRPERLAPPQADEVRVATEFSGISRGTERLVALGEVPASEWQRMRAPLQAGTFPFPVKYGYSATGVVVAGSDSLLGSRVFCLHPHQDHFQVDARHVAPLPDAVPSRRATLAANMETALNAHWDAGTQPGDRVLVVGAGIVGLLIAYLARRIAGTQVAITDIAPERAEIAAKLGIQFVLPTDAPRDNAIVFHTTATSSGLQTAIDHAAFEGRIVEVSWYGDTRVTLSLGAAFHSQRLSIISSQVGHVAPRQRGSKSHRGRLQIAIGLLDDPALDALVGTDVAFDELPAALSSLWSQSSKTLPPVVRYSQSVR